MCKITKAEIDLRVKKELDKYANYLYSIAEEEDMDCYVIKELLESKKDFLYVCELEEAGIDDYADLT